MEARDFAETLKDVVHVNEVYSLPDVIDTKWGYGDSDFFVETDDGTFLVTVAKVSE